MIYDYHRAKSCYFKETSILTSIIQMHKWIRHNDSLYCEVT